MAPCDRSLFSPVLWWCRRFCAALPRRRRTRCGEQSPSAARKSIIFRWSALVALPQKAAAVGELRSSTDSIVRCGGWPLERRCAGSACLPFCLLRTVARFFLLDGGDTKPSLYLKIEREHAITWQDITGALHLMRNECEPYGFVSCCSYEKTLSEISTWFLAPFLGGGLDSFFRKGSSRCTGTRSCSPATRPRRPDS